MTAHPGIDGRHCSAAPVSALTLGIRTHRMLPSKKHIGAPAIGPAELATLRRLIDEGTVSASPRPPAS